jgi:hypothetical protein
MELRENFMKNLKSEDLDIALNKAGSDNRYQYILLLSLLFLKIVTDSFYCPLPYFLMDPKIKCLDETFKYTKECNMGEVCNNNNTYLDLKKAINVPDILANFTTIKIYKYQESISKDFSFITFFDLECDFLTIGFLASSISIGSLLSNIIGPVLTENIGRIGSITLILIFDIIIKSSIFFIPKVELLFMIFLFTNITNNCIYNSISLYINEMVYSGKRGLFFCIFNSMYGISGIIYTIIFNIFFSWKILQCISIGASFISLLINIFFLKESIRYLFMKNRKAEIFETLRCIAKINGRIYEYEDWENSFKMNSDLSLDSQNQESSLSNSFENNSNISNNNNNENNNNHNHNINIERRKNVFSKIFSNWEVIINFFTFNIISLVIISGIIYNAIEIKMSKDTFIYPIIFYTIDFFIIFLTGYIIEIPALGRKIPAIFFALLASIFYSAKYMDILENPYSSRFWIDLLIRQSVGISFNILMEYNLEIYSTDIRATAFNLNKIFSRLGDFFTPILLAKNRGFCTLVLSIFYICTAILILNLKETQGVHLSEKVNEGEDYYKNSEKESKSNIGSNNEKKEFYSTDNEENEKLK